MSTKDVLWAGARSVAAGLQRGLGIWPKTFCLISGAPRSGTTAVARWLGEQPRVALCIESRTLVAAHRFLDEVHRFEALAKYDDELARSARRMVKDHYRGKRLLFGRRALVDKEPLEPIALPDGRYDAFVSDVRRLLPKARLLFLVRDPVASVYSMRKRDWGVSLTDADPRRFSLEDHVESWCRAVDVILSYVEDPQAYICEFGRLRHDAVEESRRIAHFLEISEGPSFRPREAGVPDFGEEERARILAATRERVEALASHGLSNLG
jgi:hypothetical protein